jgi:hypothetical protein
VSLTTSPPHASCSELPCPTVSGMKTISLGNTGFAEVQADGSFRMSLRGPMTQEDALRLARWLLRQGEGESQN